MADHKLDPIDSDPAVERRWAEEIRDRIRAFKAGEMQAISSEQALVEAHQLLAVPADEAAAEASESD